MVREGRFREDLYYRLRVFPILLPALRNRKEDIPLLVDHFIKHQNRQTGKHIQAVSNTAMGTLMDYAWPGNVRELENAVEHAFVLCQGSRIERSHLPLEIREYDGQHPAAAVSPASNNSRRGKRITRERLVRLLEACDWNKAEVARQVGLSRTAIWKYMKKWDIPLQK
jgi:DNA-binding NtrC family response regulator